MCGILGIVAPPGGRVGLSQAQIESLRDTMTSRGPDGSGLFMRQQMAFAHRRLAIRDRTGGAQPWVSDDGQIVLVYNGELYNDRELRKQLTTAGIQTRSRCDTEVVLAAYQTWGVDCVRYLRGMFAFGIYDFRDDSLLVVRDRFGVKPLFLTEIDGGIAFASSISCLIQYPGLSKQPNWAVISHYLSTLRLTLGSETVYQGIWTLLPGHLMRFHNGCAEVTRYWEYPDAEDNSLGYEDATRILEDELDEAVKVRLQSDVPVGMFLSGGVDSSTIACHIRRHHGESMLGQCGGGDGDSCHAPDFEFASRCAKHIGFDYGEVRVSSQVYRDRWFQLIRQYQTPLSTPSDVIIYSLAQRMKESVGVVLGGEGADELLCGYAVQHWAGHDYDGKHALDTGSWTFGQDAARVFMNGLRQQYGRDSFDSPTDHYFALNSLIPTSGKPALLQDWAWEQSDQDHRMWRYYETQFGRLESLQMSQRHARLLHTINLEALLSRLDSATMLASLEARVPFTDHHLVEKMLLVPQRHKIAIDPSERSPYLPSGQLEARGTLLSKRPLRSLAKRMMPDDLAFRKKASFPTPVQSWLAGPWSEWAGQTLRDSPFANAVFRPEAIDQLAGNVSQAGMWLWPLLNVSLWGDSEFN